MVPLASWAARRGSDGVWAVRHAAVGFPCGEEDRIRMDGGGRLEVGVVKGKDDIEATRRK